MGVGRREASASTGGYGVAARGQRQGAEAGGDKVVEVGGSKAS